jgi:hypothetical protein
MLERASKCNPHVRRAHHRACEISSSLSETQRRGHRGPEICMMYEAGMEWPEPHDALTSAVQKRTCELSNYHRKGWLVSLLGRVIIDWFRQLGSIHCK